VERKEYVLACLSAGESKSFSPVQVQKLFFLIDRNVPHLVSGPHFSFEPYLYGPFDKAVYSELEALVAVGLIRRVSAGKFSNYVLTDEGAEVGSRFFQELPVAAQHYVRTSVRIVQTLSFRHLVSAIYEAYPDMRKNSVFTD
jgi:hypothetical protein